MLGRLVERFQLFRHRKQIKDLHQVLWVYTFVFIVWGLYRGLLFEFPVWLEETIFKFLVFGVPVFWVIFHREKGSLEDLGMTTKGLIVSLYFGLLFGLWLAVFGNLVSFINDGGVGFNPDLTVADFQNVMILGLATAFWEQILFAGYMLPRIVKDLRDENTAIIMLAFLFALLHMPIQFTSGAGLGQIVIRFILLFSLQFGNSILYLRFKNLAAPIFAHLAWGSVIYLFG